MKPPAALVLVALVLSVPLSVFAKIADTTDSRDLGKGKLTSKELVALCDSSEPGAVKNCQNYIRGVTEAFALSNPVEAGVCLPQTLPPSVVALAASIELSNDSDSKNNTTLAVVRLKKLLATQYPCP